MSFLIYCSNKGCGKNNEALLNTVTNEVECLECGKVITNVTIFTKIQMKALGQIKRESKSAQAFAVQCKKCGKTLQPVVKDNKVLCASCGEHLTHLSAAFVNAVKGNVKKAK